MVNLAPHPLCFFILTRDRNCDIIANFYRNLARISAEDLGLGIHQPYKGSGRGVNLRTEVDHGYYALVLAVAYNPAECIFSRIRVRILNAGVISNVQRFLIPVYIQQNNAHRIARCVHGLAIIDMDPGHLSRRNDRFHTVNLYEYCTPCDINYAGIINPLSFTERILHVHFLGRPVLYRLCSEPVLIPLHLHSLKPGCNTDTLLRQETLRDNIRLDSDCGVQIPVFPVFLLFARICTFHIIRNKLCPRNNDLPAVVICYRLIFIYPGLGAHRLQPSDNNFKGLMLGLRIQQRSSCLGVL